MKVLITGATGFVGRVVVDHLLEESDEVVVLTRNIPRAAITLGSRCKYFQWPDTNQLPPLEAFEGVDGVINLMGENISKGRWTEERKKALYNSRIDGTARLVEAMGLIEKRPKSMVSISAVGIYGERSNEEITEESPLGDDFLAHLCKEWEFRALGARQLGLRVSIVRSGVVLGKGGGALSQMLPVFKLGLGGPLGSGKQYMSWIHAQDLAALLIRCLKDDGAAGIYDGTAPYPATNKEFSKALGKALRRPVLFPVPGFAIKAALGEMSTVLLKGQRVLPARAKELKFRYTHPTLDLALKETVH